MLELFGTGQTPVLRHVPHQDDWNATRFRRKEQVGRSLANLTDAPRSRLQLEREDRLNGIDNEEDWFQPVNLLKDALETCLGQYIQWGGPHTQPITAHLDLVL